MSRLTGIAGPASLNQMPATGYNPDQHTAFAPPRARMPAGQLNMDPAGSYARPQGPGPMMNPQRAGVATEVPGASRFAQDNQ